MTLDLTLKNQVQRKKTANVIGKIPGRDPVLWPEAVIYTAHHDHLGKKAERQAGRRTRSTTAPSTTRRGVASLLSVAAAVKALPQAPKRTVYFATVAAEEQGLLGSRYLAAHPRCTPAAWPPTSTWTA